MIEIGSSIGRYHILEQLGEGGMATVYRAFDTRLDNEVALKILRVDIFGPAVLERLAKRFEREAKLMAAMSHRGIVKVTDYGEYNGAPYLVMELLPGGTLKDRMGKPFPYAEAARLAAQVAHALNYAHQRKHPILHRDVKPANILVNEEGELVLTDFGIAKVLAETEGNTLTGTGVGIGTPEYMAPEQGMGKEVDGRADVYALGVVFYELITGRKPFTADTPMAVILKHVTDPLPPPKLFVPDLPDQVERVLFKALAKKPEDRYRTMEEFIAAVERLIADIGLAPTKPAEFQTKPEYFAVDEAETDEITRDLVEDAQSANPEPDPSALPGNFSLPGWTPDPGVSTIDDNVQSLPAETPRQTRRRVKPWQGLALAAVLVIAAIGIIFVTKPSPGAVPGTITPIISTATTSPVSPTLQPSPEITAAIEGTAVPIPFGAEIMRLGDGILSEIAYSPDGKTLVAASSIGILFYDAGTLEKIRFIDTDSWISSIAFSPDGRILATGSRDGTIQLRNAQNGESLQILRLDKDCFPTVVFSPDGGTLASWAGNDVWCGGTSVEEITTIQLWDVESGALLQTLEGHTDRIFSVAFSPDGLSLASGSFDNTINVWDMESGALVQTLEGHTSVVYSVAFSSDGRGLASGSNDNTLRLWNVESGALLKTLEGHTSSVNSVAFSPEGNRLASGSADGTIKLWDAQSGTLLHTLEGQEGVSSVTFSPNGSELASVLWNNTIQLWNVQSGALLQTLEGHRGPVYSVAFSPDGSSLASGSEDENILLWNAESGTLLQTLTGEPRGGVCIAFSPDGRWFASGHVNGRIKLWDAVSGSLLRTIIGHNQPVESLSFAPDGRRFASSSWGGSIILWDTENGTILRTLEKGSGLATVVIFTSNGERLASGTNYGAVKLWDAKNGELLHILHDNTGGVGSIAYSPDGHRLTSGKVDGTIQLWDMQSGALLQTLEGHNLYVSSVVFSSDGRWLASGSGDNTIRLWDAQSGTLLRTLQGHTGEVYSVAFSPDGSTLASGSEDGTIRIWNMASR